MKKSLKRALKRKTKTKKHGGVFESKNIPKEVELKIYEYALKYSADDFIKYFRKNNLIPIEGNNRGNNVIVDKDLKKRLETLRNESERISIKINKSLSEPLTKKVFEITFFTKDRIIEIDPNSSEWQEIFRQSMNIDLKNSKEEFCLKHSFKEEIEDPFDINSLNRFEDTIRIIISNKYVIDFYKELLTYLFGFGVSKIPQLNKNDHKISLAELPIFRNKDIKIDLQKDLKFVPKLRLIDVKYFYSDSTKETQELEMELGLFLINFPNILRKFEKYKDF